jgi:L-alanine-DL-glutamate epimerase-like enolase superfamily enzyme
MGEKGKRAHDSGRFKRLKLKLGARDGLDVERVRAVREVTDVPLQVDVNEYWTLDEALDALPRLDELGVEYCEQPLPAGDENGAALKKASPMPIYVDEDCHTLADVTACATIAHGINIKLAKSGGIREAVRMAHAARALGLGVMLGCMVESGLGIAAGASIASLCDHVDLDGNLLIAHDPWPGVELVDGIQTPSEEPGLGVRQEVPDPR